MWNQIQPFYLFSSYFIRKSHLGSGGSPVRTAIVIQDDSLPAAPPPQIRILKRPTNNGTSGNPAASSRPTQQMKTLAQREAEYAEARRRILGSASSEETPPDNPGQDRLASVESKQMILELKLNTPLLSFPQAGSSEHTANAGSSPSKQSSDPPAHWP